MRELSEATLMHDAILAAYARALGSGSSEIDKQHGYRNSADLLQHELGCRSRDANMLLRLAEVMRDGTYPTLAVALEDGRVSVQQAHVIVDVLDEHAHLFDVETIEWVEASATDFAIGDQTALPMKPEMLRKLVRAWFKKLQPEKTELDAAKQHLLREASYATTKTGMMRIRALLTAEEGAAVAQFLDANAAPRVRFSDPKLQETECCCTNPVNNCEARYGSVSGETPAIARHCDACEPEDPRTRKQKMADAFSNAFSIAGKSKESSTQGGGYPTVVVTISVDDLAKHAQGVPAVSTIQRTEEVVPAHVAARMLCDGAIRLAVMGEDNEVLSLGRSQRLFTPAQRLALAQKYPTCALRDCDIPAVWCEAHHIQWWQKGGPTDLDNGILLCNYHHHQVHAGALSVAAADDVSASGSWRVSAVSVLRQTNATPETDHTHLRVLRASQRQNALRTSTTGRNRQVGTSAGMTSEAPAIKPPTKRMMSLRSLCTTEREWA